MEISYFVFLVGIIILFISFIISEKSSGSKSDNENVTVVDDDFVNKIITENEAVVRKNIEQFVQEKVEEEVVRADEQLGHISNEKIMAVTEHSDQLLEKIEQNHKEVVFLYDMLNTKENEMKDFVQEIDKSKVVLEELANKELEKQKMLQHKRIQKELEKQLKREEELAKERQELLKSRMIAEEKKKETVSSNTVQDVQYQEEIKLSEETEKKVETQMSALEKMGNTLETVNMEKTENVSNVVNATKASNMEEKDFQPNKEKEAETSETNPNQVILNLYNEGKTIMEIAKTLGKGQGEVKLVIDLFQGAKK